jgi:hypothetical protein
VRLGLTEREVAEKVGLSVPSYYDLEGFDDEWSSVVDVCCLINLSSILHISLMELMGAVHETTPTLTPAELANLVRVKLESGSVSKDSLSWEVGDFVANPEVAKGYTIDFFRDLGAELGFDWLAAIHGLQQSVKSA